MSDNKESPQRGLRAQVKFGGANPICAQVGTPNYKRSRNMKSGGVNPICPCEGHRTIRLLYVHKIQI
jgi:hypothetical protein